MSLGVVGPSGPRVLGTSGNTPPKVVNINKAKSLDYIWAYNFTPDTLDSLLELSIGILKPGGQLIIPSDAISGQIQGWKVEKKDYLDLPFNVFYGNMTNIPANILHSRVSILTKLAAGGRRKTRKKSYRIRRSVKRQYSKVPSGMPRLRM